MSYPIPQPAPLAKAARKTAAERQAARRQRAKQSGLVAVTVFVPATRQARTAVHTLADYLQHYGAAGAFTVTFQRKTPI